MLRSWVMLYICWEKVFEEYGASLLRNIHLILQISPICCLCPLHLPRQILNLSLQIRLQTQTHKLACVFFLHFLWKKRAQILNLVVSFVSKESIKSTLRLIEKQKNPIFCVCMLLFWTHWPRDINQSFINSQSHSQFHVESLLKSQQEDNILLKIYKSPSFVWIKCNRGDLTQ